MVCLMTRPDIWEEKQDPAKPYFFLVILFVKKIVFLHPALNMEGHNMGPNFLKAQFY